MMTQFPAGFVWGVAASAYQIEGAVRADGRGISVWDRFCRRPGAVAGGDTGDIACDHYHRSPEDVGLMARLGVGAYRFSTSWPRILPEGSGRPNAAGLDFYDRLVDRLLDSGIEPWLCLHHWDLPERLEDRGGWRNPDLPRWFADYAVTVLQRLADRVRRVAPINEPNVLAWLGHCLGIHAPGHRSRAATAAAIHHLNMAHGRTAEAVRSLFPAVETGLIMTMGPVTPLRDDGAHAEAAAWMDALWNRAMVDPIMLGRYPEEIAPVVAPHVREGDLALLHRPADFFGLNHYNRLYARPDPDNPFGHDFAETPAGLPVTDTGWQIDPSALLEQILDVAERYKPAQLFITENGAAFPDRVEPDGRIDDAGRVAFLQGYLRAVGEAIEKGVAVKGYFVWSLLDNFEWEKGYSKRFGLVHVDYASQARTPKRSYAVYQAIIGSNGAEGLDDGR